jgi:hypothetical protein
MKEIDALIPRLAAWYMAHKTAQLYSFFVKKGREVRGRKPCLD